MPLRSCVYFQEGPGLRKWQFGDNGIPFLNIRTFNKGRIDKSKCQFVILEEFKGKYEHFLLDEGDIVVSSSGTIGKLAVISKVDLPVMLNTSIIRFRSLWPDRLLQEYLKYYLQSESFFSQITSSVTGTAISNYGPSHLKQMWIVVPPLNEQRRIVAKLEKLLAKVDACKQRLEKIPTILARFRQSVLARACSGRLTADWREQNPALESVEDRLKGFQKARLSLATNERDYQALFKKFNQLVVYDSKLPEGWIYLSAECLCDFITKGTTPKKSELLEKGDIPYLKVQHIVNNKINFWPLPCFVSCHTHEEFLKRSKVFPRDVLMNIVGPPLNKVAIVPDEFPEWNINQALAIFRPINGMTPECLAVILSFEGTTEEVLRRTRGVVGQSNISLGQCRNLKIPVPPLAEQQEIVRRVESLLQKGDRIEQGYQKAKAKIDQLEQSILAKAFRGELVPQDPNDEPASVLLDRIREERAKEQKAKTAKKSAKKTAKTTGKRGRKKAKSE
ncbi:MAG: hypothetical protein F6J93_32150 [Oscillatoria sp. SIO1A7]|nr:hypothetical protein [Oscillatoria sp. SIO1A7]